jgi:hypothetical protein
MPLLDREMLKKTGIMGLATGQLLVFIGCGWWLGGWLDRKWNSVPIFSVALALLGLSFAGWRIWRQAKDWMK